MKFSTHGGNLAALATGPRSASWCFWCWLLERRENKAHAIQWFPDVPGRWLEGTEILTGLRLLSFPPGTPNPAGRAVQWAIRISCPGARLCGETDKWLCAHLFVVNTNAR